METPKEEATAASSSGEAAAAERSNAEETVSETLTDEEPDSDGLGWAFLSVPKNNFINRLFEQMYRKRWAEEDWQRSDRLTQVLNKVPEKSRAEKKARRLLMKHGLKPVEDVKRVTMQGKNEIWHVDQPDVYKLGDTYIYFGKYRIEKLTK